MTVALVLPTDPILHKRCEEIVIVPKNLILEMFRLLRESGGYGLAAPQVGFNARIFITRWDEIFINPIITEKHNIIYVHEGCLSFPKKIATKRRYADICICNHWFHGTEAITIQHELDHLNGITIETSDSIEQGNVCPSLY